MPLGFPIMTGAQSPISAGGGTSGAATSGGSGAVSVGGLFGSPASNPGFSTNTVLVLAVAVLGAIVLFKRK